MVITGTEDGSIPAASSLIIAGKIPGAWLVQIPAAGHSVMDQYPAKVAEILTYLLQVKVVELLIEWKRRALTGAILLSNFENMQ